MNFMGKTILVAVCAVALCLGGCSTGQLQDLEEMSKTKLVIHQSIAKLDVIKNDANLTDEQKIAQSINTVSEKAVELGLVPPEQGDSFVKGLNMALDSYLAIKPLGVAKIDWTIIITLAVFLWKRR